MSGLRPRGKGCRTDPGMQPERAEDESESPVVVVLISGPSLALAGRPSPRLAPIEPSSSTATPAAATQPATVRAAAPRRRPLTPRSARLLTAPPRPGHTSPSRRPSPARTAPLGLQAAPRGSGDPRHARLPARQRGQPEGRPPKGARAHQGHPRAHGDPARQATRQARPRQLVRPQGAPPSPPSHLVARRAER